jgi:hypothetical protein
MRPAKRPGERIADRTRIPLKAPRRPPDKEEARQGMKLAGDLKGGLGNKYENENNPNDTPPQVAGTSAPIDGRAFWMVSRTPKVTDKGLSWGGPRMRHPSLEQANREARRLARKFGEPFVILGIVDVVTPPIKKTGGLNA